MSSFFPNGTIFSIGTVYAAPKNVTAISNANPGVVSATAHGLTTGDPFVLTSGWGALNGGVFIAGTTTADSFPLLGVDTLDTSLYPAGAGGGSIKKVTTWVGLSQITAVETSGGEQQFYQWQYLEENTQRQRPTVKNARQMKITMDFDPALPWHDALLAADRKGTPHAIRAAMPSGSTVYYAMYAAFDGEPSFDINQNQSVVLSLSFDNPRSRRY